MKRTTKNLLSIALIFILCILIYFTMFFTKNLTPTRNIPDNTMQFQMQNGMRNRTENPQQQPQNEMQRQPNNMFSEPQMPQGNMQVPPNNNFRQDFRNPNARTSTLPLYYYFILGAESLLLSILLLYLIMSNLNKKTLKETFVNADKITIFILALIILTTIFTLVTSALTTKVFMPANNPFALPEEDEEEIIIDVDAGTLITDNNINLADYSTNITINKAGNYTLTGSTNNSVLVEADGDVTLTLDNVNIKSQITSSIANISTNKLTIILADNSINNLKDNGESQYDGCLFSSGPLIIEGNGTLNIVGSQNEGEGIATDTNDITINGGTINITSNDDGINAGGDGGIITINGGNIYVKANGDGIDSNKDILINGGKLYTMGSALGGDAGIDADGNFIINGGEVIALGSDMLLRPSSTSIQNSLSITLPEIIQVASVLTLKTETGEIITTFTADENFRTLILSNDKLTKGEYSLFKNNTELITTISI